MYRTTEERSLGDLFADLTREITTLIRQEIRLATVEISHKTSQVGKHIAFIVAGGLIAYAGFFAIEAMAVMLLSQVVDWWLAALIVGLAVMGVGYFLVKNGLDNLKKVDLTPRHTAASIQETVEWAKEQTQ